MNPAIHDPQRDAASYLDGALSADSRRSFEAHMVACDACWAEISAARTGRALAESLRESAPQTIRERLRAIATTEPDADAPVEATPQRPARWRSGTGRIVAAGASIAVVAVALTGVAPSVITGPDSAQNPLQAAATVYQADTAQTGAAAEQPPLRRIGDLTWQGTAVQPLAGQAAVVHRYRDAAGHRLMLVSSTEQFPRADTAQTVGPGPSWIADIDGAVMFCADRDGLSWLVITDSRAQALAAGRAVGLT